jgi:hypothetical protein
MSEERWRLAYDEFFEAFRNYQVRSYSAVRSCSAARSCSAVRSYNVTEQRR